MPGFMPGRPTHGSLAWAADQVARLLDLEEQAISRQSRHRAAAKGGRGARQHLDSRKAMHFEPAADFDTPGQAPEAPQRPLDGSAPRGNVNQASRMEHLRMLTKIAGLSPASRDAAREMAANLELSKAMVNTLSDPVRNIDKRRERQFVAAIKNDPDLMRAVGSWTDSPGPGELSRQEAARRLLEHQARIYGFPMQNVVFEDLGDDRLGEHRRYQNTIALHHLHPQWQNFKIGVRTAAHEGMHAYATRLLRDFAEGRISMGDPRYPLIQMLRYNRRFYTDLDDDKSRYVRQPYEAFANSINPPLAAVFGALPPKQYPPNEEP